MSRDPPLFLGLLFRLFGGLLLRLFGGLLFLFLFLFLFLLLGLRDAPRYRRPRERYPHSLVHLQHHRVIGHPLDDTLDTSYGYHFVPPFDLGYHLFVLLGTLPLGAYEKQVEYEDHDKDEDPHPPGAERARFRGLLRGRKDNPWVSRHKTVDKCHIALSSSDLSLIHI